MLTKEEVEFRLWWLIERIPRNTYHMKDIAPHKDVNGRDDHEYFYDWSKIVRDLYPEFAVIAMMKECNAILKKLDIKQ